MGLPPDVKLLEILHTETCQAGFVLAQSSRYTWWRKTPSRGNTDLSLVQAAPGGWLQIFAAPSMWFSLVRAGLKFP